MREIKFRAWDNKNKHWLMGYEYPNLGGFSLVGESILFGQWGSTFDKFLFEKDGLKGTDLIVEQYTGLKDKNGKEIYEGDIVKQDRYEPLQTVVFHLGRFVLQLKSGICNDYIPCLAVEVIGNIHENPESLK